MIPMAILLQLVHRFSDRIKQEMIEFGSDPESLKYLLEDKNTRERREVLTEKLSRLSKAMARISIVC